jgi:hypothetical protein
VTARRALQIAGVAAALGAWCGWASGFHRSTTPAAVTWGISLTAVVLVDVLLWRGRRGLRPGWRVEAGGRPWPRPGRGGGANVLKGTWPWLGLTFVVLAWESLGIDTGAHQAHLTISALCQAFRGLDAALLAIWILVGWGYGWAKSRAPALAGSPTTGRAASDGGRHRAAVVLVHAPASLPALLLPSNRAVGVGFWVGLTVAGVLVDLEARHSGGRRATAEELVRFVAGPVAANVVVVAAWAFAGYHLFAR